MLAAAGSWGEGTTQRPYLARAFSVCRVRGGRRDFLIDDIGPGTRRLAQLEAGEDLWLTGPLGLGFSKPETLISGSEYRAGFAGHLNTTSQLPTSREPASRRSPHVPKTPAPASQATESPTPILVGGGIGIAPLVIWGEALADAGVPARTLLGFRSREHCGAADLVGGAVEIATDDGSAGHHGLVTDLLARALDTSPGRVVYACGPPRMLEVVRELCAEQSVPVELAMEEAMACGFGACYACVVKTRDGYRRLCVDGPVIRGSDLDGTWLDG
jgi:NAD(P)H-flavin reductase